MGFFGRLFGGGARKPPEWAREAFGKDGDNFKTFIDVVIYVLGEHTGEDEYVTAEPEYVATGSIVVGEGADRREWHMLDAALACSKEADHGKWDAIVGASLAEALGRSSGAPATTAGGVRAPSGPPEAWQEARRAKSPRQPWIIGCQPSGGVLFECGKNEVIFVVLPIADRAPFAEIAKLTTLAKAMRIARVIVCNTGDDGHLAGTAFARACGLAHVYAIDSTRPIDRGEALGGADKPKAVEVRAFGSLEEGSLYVERRGSAVFGMWRDGATFMCGHPISFLDLADTTPDHVVGKPLLDGFDGPNAIEVFMAVKQLVLPANVPGFDAMRLAKVIAQMGVNVSVVNHDVAGGNAQARSAFSSAESAPQDTTSADGPDIADPPKGESRRLRVLAHMTMNELDAADALAIEAIAAGDEVVDMHHQRAIIALMRGDETAADAHLTNIDTPQSLTSRAIIAARRSDPAAKELSLRALDRLPGDVIAIRAAVLVHALAGDRDKARAILAANAQHLDDELRFGLDNSIDDPPRQFGHNFPEHAKLVFDAVKPMLDAGEYEKAEPLLRRAAAWDPENLGIIGDLGFTLSKLSRDADAIAVYDAAIARGGSRVLLRFNRGNCQLRRQNFDEAAADFRACVELKADWHEARVNLVSALFASGDKTGARREIDQLKTLGGPPQFVTSLEQMLAGTL